MYKIMDFCLRKEVNQIIARFWQTHTQIWLGNTGLMRMALNPFVRKVITFNGTFFELLDPRSLVYYLYVCVWFGKKIMRT